MQFRSLSEGDPAENRVIFAVCFLRRTIPILAKILSSKYLIAPTVLTSVRTSRDSAAALS